MIQFKDCYNEAVLSNNNQTITCGAGTKALLDTIVNKRKLYLEIKVDVLGNYPYIGIVNADVYDINNADYPPYVNTENLITTLLNKISAIGILSILLDCDSKNLEIKLNDKTVLLSKSFSFNNVNLIVGNGTSNGSGGGTQFTIINEKDLNYSVPQDYKYYTNEYPKFLLKQNNQYYSIKSQFYDGKMYKPCTKDYKANGFEDLNGLIKETNTMIVEGSKKTENEINIFEFNINDTINKIEVI